MTDDQPLPCIVCKKQLEATLGEWRLPRFGVTVMAHGSYGSDFDDEPMAFTVCDDCLRKNRAIVRGYRNPRAPQPDTEFGPFAPWLDSVPASVDAGPDGV